jgi:hypothetical protein
VRIDGTPREQLLAFIALSSDFCTFAFCYLPSCLGINSLRLFIPTFGTPCVPSSRTTPTMHPDEAPPQEPTNHPPLNQSSTQILSTIDAGLEHPSFGNIHEVQLHQPTHASTKVAGPSQTNGVATSNHTTGGALRQSTLRAPSPIHMLPGDTELSQVRIDDWDKEAEEKEAAVEEGELARVQQEIERLQQEQESILRR